MAKVREIAWPEEFKDLKRIEEFMICGICYEYINTSVMTPCSHNYCSVCIRKYLHYKTQCPACFHDFFEKDLYINRSMDGLIQHYIQIREKLISLIQNRNIYNSVINLEEEQSSTPPVRPARSSQIPRSPKLLESQQSESIASAPHSPLVDASNSNMLSVAKLNSPSTSKINVSSPTSSRSPKVVLSIAKIFNTPKRKEVAAPLPVVNTKSVSCPVCSVDISEQHINVHLDACLKRETGQGVVKKKPSAPKRPPLPKLVLRVMKDAELRKKMKEFGLPTLGDRKTLENRFTRYSVIYNAECDKPDPRPVSELIRQCEMEEKQERKMDCFLVSASTSNRLQIERNAQEEKIEEAQKNYRLTNKSSFDKLIEEVRNRRKAEKEKQQQEKKKNNEIDSISEPSTSTVETSTENTHKNENTSSVPSAGTTFQDSDSDESYPLQHYRSDNAVKCLSVNLEDSSSQGSTPNTPIKKQKVKTKNSRQPRKSKVSKTNTDASNLYEMSTDDSMDDEVLCSPQLKKNNNRKRTKTANESSDKSPLSLISEATNNDSKDKESRETVARDMCNSIIKDFSFDGSDNSSNEFTETRPNRVIETVPVDKQSLDTNNILNSSKLMEKFNSSLEKEDEVNNTIVNNKMNGFVDDIASDMLNDDDFAEFVNKMAENSDKIEEKKINGNEKDTSLSNDVQIEKENNAILANKHSEASGNDNVISRPVRKRNLPSRYADATSTKRTAREKTPNHVTKSTNDEGVTNNQNNIALDGSLKRRRVRQKIESTDQPPDDVQNPPKRPVRRRQTTTDQNSS